ncbi:ArsC/Spx/MgsR family protein [Candidatus Pollutiaquabacter sp.]|uniref:ArsC/Spx/MgsR family protein n=1 Tax=Candidatus Pollutiaquabacter sp. TaxID=3416354 RepID=UPI003CA17ED2|nr:arsenate reductase (glutaredoxin) [Bacteroidota bacterium]
MLRIWFKPTCSTCQTALAYLKDQGEEDVEIFEYMKEQPKPEDLREALQLLGLKARDIVRESEKVFAEKYAGKELSEEEWISAMCEHTELIERPIVVKDGKAIIGRPAERVLDLY